MFISRLFLVCALAIFSCLNFSLAADFKFGTTTITVPDDFTVELDAEAPLVGHPMMAGFDERGRLFISEAAGTNAQIDVLEKITPNFIRMIEDKDGDGKFDKSTIFVDNLQIPNGALWHNGSLYVAEPPGLWRYTDTNNDGVADVREHLAGRVKSNGMSASLHGPVLGPTGRLFWCGGQSGYSLDKNQELPGHRIAPGVFSLRTDGSGHEAFSVGGMANPVEVAFSPEGEVFGTVAILDHFDGARHDALMHWVYGGVYNINPNDPCPLKRTGDFLPPLSHVGQVAPAGVMRYRGQQFGEEFRDNLFWAQFNTRKIIRTRLTRDGATFRSQDEDFFVADNVDFHCTDVFEDADGSLLVIDTGGWFRHGCPTSQIAKPDVQGGIYRIRRNGAKKTDDPRGLKINWAKADATMLTKLLDDPRPAVEDRAIATLASRGIKVLPALQKTLQESKSTQARRNVVWTLSRIGTKEANGILTNVLQDKDDSVRQAAVYAAGMEQIEDSLSQLTETVVKDAQFSVRREAATALGRLGKTNAVPSLLNALAQPADRFLEHSLIYALIQINAPALTEIGLTNGNSRVRRGALIALSQMENVELTCDQIRPLLKGDDLDLQKAAFDIAIKNTNCTTEIILAFQNWLVEKDQPEARAVFLKSAIVGQAGNVAMQQLIADLLGKKETPASTRLLLLDAIKRPSIKKYPEIWNAALERELQSGTEETRLAAVSIVQERGSKNFDGLLTKMAQDEKVSLPLRFAFLATVAPRLSPVNREFLDLLRANLKTETTPLVRLAAARTLATLKLSDPQLVEVVEILPKMDALALPTLLRSFSHSTNEEVGLALVHTLEKTPAAQNLSPDELAQLVKKFSSVVQTAAKPLLEKLGADLDKQQARLEELAPILQGGDFSRGKQIFFGKKASCATCHRISGQGGIVGPNLSQIAKIRAGRDLLESILYPSASIVQGFRPYNVETKDDQIFTGILVRETAEAIWLRGTDLAETKIEQAKIQSMTESALSIMPQGLENALTKEELQDLLAYLQALK